MSLPARQQRFSAGSSIRCMPTILA